MFREVHIFIQRGNDIPMDAGSTIVQTLRPACMSQAKLPKIVVVDVGEQWPSDIKMYAFGHLFRQGYTPNDFANIIEENGTAFGKRIYVIYINPSLFRRIINRFFGSKPT